MQKVDTVIIGAGLTGLTAAHYLNKKEKSFIVLEQSERIGGVINSHTENGFVYEDGPNTGVIGCPEVVELFDDLKGRCELEIANDNVKKRYILKKGKWNALPTGPMSAITTPLFSWYDKFRILGEPFRAKGNNPHETLAAMVIRRMGQSFLDYAIDPFILGVYSGDPALLVPKYALPKLYYLEQTYGSFIKGAMRKKKEPKTEREQKANRKVFSAKGGLVNFTNAIYESAGKEHFVTGAKEVVVANTEEGYTVSYILNGETKQIVTKNVITTTGAYTLNNILPFVDATLLDKINSLKYAKVVEVVLGFNKWNGCELDGFGGLIPFKEKRDILGVLFMSSLLSNRVPEGGAMLTLFLGGVRREEICTLNDEEIKHIVEKEVVELMDLKQFKPDLFKINRYQKAIAQYYADSGERFKAIQDIEAKHSGLYLGGNIRDGIGMADRIKQGSELAENIK